MKESQIIQQRIASLEIDLAEARQVLAEVVREEAARGTSAERREYAVELYEKILALECDSLDIESDAVDSFINQVLDPEHRKEIAEALSGYAYFGSLPIIRECNDATVDKIIKVLEACIDYIEFEGVLDMWLEYDPATNVIYRESEDDDEE